MSRVTPSPMEGAEPSLPPLTQDEVVGKMDVTVREKTWLEKMRQASVKGALADRGIALKMFPERIQKLFADGLDEDGDGFLEMDELEEMVTQHQSLKKANATGHVSIKSLPEKVQPALKTFDMDGDGNVDPKELQRAAELYEESKTNVRRLRYFVMGLMGFIIFLIGLNAAMTFAMIEISKESTVEGDVMKSATTGHAVQTASSDTTMDASGNLVARNAVADVNSTSHRRRLLNTIDDELSDPDVVTVKTSASLAQQTITSLLSDKAFEELRYLKMVVNGKSLNVIISGFMRVREPRCEFGDPGEVILITNQGDIHISGRDLTLQTSMEDSLINAGLLETRSLSSETDSSGKRKLLAVSSTFASFGIFNSLTKLDNWGSGDSVCTKILPPVIPTSFKMTGKQLVPCVELKGDLCARYDVPKFWMKGKDDKLLPMAASSKNIHLKQNTAYRIDVNHMDKTGWTAVQILDISNRSGTNEAVNIEFQRNAEGDVIANCRESRDPLGEALAAMQNAAVTNATFVRVTTLEDGQPVRQWEIKGKNTIFTLYDTIPERMLRRFNFGANLGAYDVQNVHERGNGTQGITGDWAGDKALFDYNCTRDRTYDSPPVLEYHRDIWQMYQQLERFSIDIKRPSPSTNLTDDILKYLMVSNQTNMTNDTEMTRNETFAAFESSEKDLEKVEAFNNWYKAGSVAGVEEYVASVKEMQASMNASDVNITQMYDHETSLISPMFAGSMYSAGKRRLMSRNLLFTPLQQDKCKNGPTACNTNAKVPITLGPIGVEMAPPGGSLTDGFTGSGYPMCYLKGSGTFFTLPQCGGCVTINGAIDVTADKWYCEPPAVSVAISLDFGIPEKVCDKMPQFLCDMLSYTIAELKLQYSKTKRSTWRKDKCKDTSDPDTIMEHTLTIAGKMGLGRPFWKFLTPLGALLTMDITADASWFMGPYGCKNGKTQTTQSVKLNAGVSFPPFFEVSAPIFGFSRESVGDDVVIYHAAEGCTNLQFHEYCGLEKIFTAWIGKMILGSLGALLGPLGEVFGEMFKAIGEFFGSCPDTCKDDKCVTRKNIEERHTEFKIGREHVQYWMSSSEDSKQSGEKGYCLCGGLRLNGRRRNLLGSGPAPPPPDNRPRVPGLWNSCDHNCHWKFEEKTLSFSGAPNAENFLVYRGTNTGDKPYACVKRSTCTKTQRTIKTCWKDSFKSDAEYLAAVDDEAKKCSGTKLGWGSECDSNQACSYWANRCPGYDMWYGYKICNVPKESYDTCYAKFKDPAYGCVDKHEDFWDKSSLEGSRLDLCSWNEINSDHGVNCLGYQWELAEGNMDEADQGINDKNYEFPKGCRRSDKIFNMWLLDDTVPEAGHMCPKPSSIDNGKLLYMEKCRNYREEGGDGYRYGQQPKQIRCDDITGIDPKPNYKPGAMCTVGGPGSGPKQNYLEGGFHHRRWAGIGRRRALLSIDNMVSDDIDDHTHLFDAHDTNGVEHDANTFVTHEIDV